MQYTEKLGLKLPESTDNYNIDDFNYNSLKLDSMDSAENIIKYLTPSVEKVQIGSGEETLVQNILPNSISPTWSSNGQDIGNNVDITLDSFGEYTPKIKITTNAVNGFKSSQNTSTYSNYITIGAMENGTPYATSQTFLNMSKRTSYNANYLARFGFAGNTQEKVVYDYDMITSCKLSLKYRIGETVFIGNIKGSNDNEIWTTLGNITFNTTGETFTSSDFYRYYKIEFLSNSAFAAILPIYYLYISQVTYNVDYYQNQFTLDNNTTFTNNQRVLVETPQNDIDINLLSGIWTESVDTLSATSGNKMVTTYETSVYDRNSIGKFLNGTNIWYGSDTSGTHNVKIDLGNEYEIKKINTNIGDGSVSADSQYFDNSIISYSTDDNEYTNLFTILSSEGAITSHQFDVISARYIKIEITTNTNRAPRISKFEIIQQDNEPKMSLDGVTSNTLNGIDIDTLLQPSTKYELIYDEDNNKFELGGLKTLFDITLTEAVNQVDLTGINNMLKEDKLYLFRIIGELSDNSIVSFGNYDEVNLCYKTKTYGESFGIFSISKKNANISFTTLGIRSSGTLSVQNAIPTHETLSLAPNETFSVGTRIIIKEIC